MKAIYLLVLLVALTSQIFSLKTKKIKGMEMETNDDYIDYIAFKKKDRCIDNRPSYVEILDKGGISLTDCVECKPNDDGKTYYCLYLYVNEDTD